MSAPASHEEKRAARLAYHHAMHVFHARCAKPNDVVLFNAVERYVEMVERERNWLRSQARQEVDVAS